MSKKNVIRLIVFVCVVLGAAVIIFIGSGFAEYLFKGYDILFTEAYISRTLKDNREVVFAPGADVTITAPNGFLDDQKEQTINTKIYRQDGSLYVVLTFKNDIGFKGSVLISAFDLKAVKDGNVNDINEVCAAVKLVSGNNQTEGVLTDITADKKSSSATYRFDDASYDCFIFSGVYITEFTRR